MLDRSAGKTTNLAESREKQLAIKIASIMNADHRNALTDDQLS